MPERLIAIGDVHGCRAALEGLLEVVAPRPSDRIVFLGDYIDRGPDSRGVIDAVLDLSEHFDVVTLMGNHEEMMLNVIDHKSPLAWWFMYGGRETIESYDTSLDLAAVPPAHVAFLRGLLPYHEEPKHFFVHANYVPDEPLKNQPAEALRWVNLKERLPEPHQNGKRAVVGHSSQKSGEVFDAGHLVCLDTFCVGGRWLTARDMLSGETWQVDPQGRLRDKA